MIESEILRKIEELAEKEGSGGTPIFIKVGEAWGFSESFDNGNSAQLYDVARFSLEKVLSKYKENNDEGARK